jgi:hypothetical protein
MPEGVPRPLRLDYTSVRGAIAAFGTTVECRGCSNRRGFFVEARRDDSDSIRRACQ